jgi:cell division protein FtsB
VARPWRLVWCEDGNTPREYTIRDADAIHHFMAENDREAMAVGRDFWNMYLGQRTIGVEWKRLPYEVYVRPFVFFSYEKAAEVEQIERQKQQAIIDREKALHAEHVRKKQENKLRKKLNKLSRSQMGIKATTDDLVDKMKLGPGNMSPEAQKIVDEWAKQKYGLPPIGEDEPF